MWLPWQPAMALAVLTGGSASPSGGRRLAGRPLQAPSTRELSLVLILYAIWQILGSIGTVREADGFTNGRTALDIERTLHIARRRARSSGGSSRTVRAVQFWNGYYAVAYAPALTIFLVWLFVRHRDRYPASATRSRS